MKRLLLILASFAAGNSGFLSAKDVPPNEPVALTAGPDGSDYWPCFSADGTKVFFSRRTNGRDWRLHQVPSEGGNITPLLESPHPVPSTRLSVSSDDRLAFVGEGSIWTTETASRKPDRLRISMPGGNPSYPSWFPDGKHLLIVAYNGPDGGTLRRVELATGASESLTDPTRILAGMANVSRDGTGIVFAGQATDGGTYDQKRNSVWVIRNGGSPEKLVGHQGRAPTWSPSGNWIAYESLHGSPDQRQAIFIVSSDGKTERRVTRYELNANHPVWSPDGRTLAFSMIHPTRPGRTCIAVLALDFQG